METINGVERFKPTHPIKSLYDHRLAYTHIIIERRTLEREIFRVIDEAMNNGGQIDDIALRCMKALDADALAEKTGKFIFETDVMRENWSGQSTHACFASSASNGANHA